MAVFVDGEAWLSTIKAVYVDKWQKKRLPSTYRPDFVDGATGLSMKTALYVDDSSLKAGLITLKKVDAANVTDIFCFSGSTAPYSSLTGECCPYNGLTGCCQSSCRPGMTDGMAVSGK